MTGQTLDSAQAACADLAVACARACLGTPFHHQGRAPGIGLDCIGLVVVALRAAGYQVRDRQDYGRRPDGKSLVRALIDHGAFVVQDCLPGDVLAFRYDGQPQHVALAVSDSGMIHSFAPAGRVVQSAIDGYWRRRLLARYRFPWPV